jgi:dTMP kinase
MSDAAFITLEGIEGVGKSTAVTTIAALFEQLKIPHTLSREPGGTAVGEKIRELLLNNSTEMLLPESECLLIFAARHQHLQHVVRPQLKAGVSVICDRFTDATFAYQGAGRGVSTQAIAYCQQWIHGDLTPNLTLLLDASVETGLSRAHARGAIDRIEAESHDFFNRVRACYLQQAKDNADRYRIIDANQPLANVQQQIEHVMKQWLDEHFKF